jgi:intron-binding protein aquarius
MAQSLDTRPTVVDFRDDSPWVQLAKAHWSNVKVRKAKPDVIKKQLYDPLEAEAFNSRTLLILENLNVLEKYDSYLIS